MKETCPADCRIAILTASYDVQETVDFLVDCGIVGIVNFTHEHIQVPKGVFLKTIDVVSTIQELVYQVNNLR